MKFLCSAISVLMMVAVVAPALAADGLVDPVRAVSLSDRPLELAVERGLVVRDGRVQVVAEIDGGDTLTVESWLTDRGALHILAIRGRVQAFVGPEHLSEFAGLPGVVSVERPIYAELPELPPPAAPRVKTLAVTSEGVAVMNVEAWQNEGFTGTGIRVGVIDLEFGGWEDLLGVELPPAGRTTYRAFGGSGARDDEVHGTACAEIVHDIAPDADLYLAHINSFSDFIAALDWLAGLGVDVVTMSLGWFGNGPGDGTGAMADEITAFIAATDALFVTSAGNERRSHWQGQSNDADLNDWVDFAPGDDLNELNFAMGGGDRIAIYLTWNDWSSPTSDYSLHLFKLGGDEPEEVAVADRPQTGGSSQRPAEQISYTTPDGGRFAIRIGRVGVVGVNDMEIFSISSDIEISVAEGSLGIPADSLDVMAVAAISYNSPFGVRGFSSAGPANGSGGSLTGGETKPDISGFDGVSTVSYGAGNYYGTSAASPHVAGAAAVVRHAEPGYTSEETRTYLETQAVNLGPTGKDNDYGWGRVLLGQTPGSDCSYSIDPAAVTVTATGRGGVIRVSTDEGCPWNTSSQVDWITAAPPSDVGSGVVGYSIDANTGPERIGDLLIADQIFVVTQASGECSFSLSPTSQSFTGDGGDGLFTVATETGCSWTATTPNDWITVTTGSGSGPGSVLFNVVAQQTADPRTGTITVGDERFTVTQEGAVIGTTVMVAGIAETEGLAQTRWKSDLAILNPGSSTAQIDLEYRHGLGTAQSSLSLAGGALVELANIAADTFGVPDSAGAVEVASDTPVVVTARTYNDGPDGTFGQFISGVAEDEGLTTGGIAALTQLSSNDGFRTNIGFVDLGGGGATARIRLYDGTGASIGSELTETATAGGWTQRNRVFNAAAAGTCTGCYALVEVVGGGPIWAYASVVDNDSGDPTTIPMELQGAAKIAADETYLVAGIAETDGANQTTWKSNLAMLNLSGQGVSADLTYRHGGGDAVSSVTLADGELREFANIAVDLFGVPGSAGAVEVDADDALTVTARTFNESADGTYGQFLPGFGADRALTPVVDGWLTQLKSTDGFRTNIGFTNFSDKECTVRAFLHDAAGVQKGMFFATIQPGGWTQVNRVFENAGAAPCPLGYAIVEVLTGGCRVWAYGSVVDNGSGDPTTVPVVFE